MTEKQIKAGRRWAYGTMLVMLALSVAGNLAHTFHISPDAGLRAQAYAVIWPLMVWAAVELFVRIPWQAILTHRLVRWVGILLVAAIAALVSYRHLRGLLVADGEEWTVYTFGPLAVDGLMLMSTLGLLLTRGLTERTEYPQEDTYAGYRETIAELESRLEARDALMLDISKREQLRGPVPASVPASQEVREHEDTMKLADLLPAPVSPAPVIPGLQLGEPIKLPGWENPNTPPLRKPRTSWDQTLARKMILEGATKAEVAEAVGKDVKTIQRLRKRMVDAGELTA